MSDVDGRPWGMCSAYGCPLFGSMAEDAGGKWYCFCHVRQPHSLNDAITAVLHRNRPMVDRVINERRVHCANGALEAEILRMIQDAGTTASIPTSPVTGPTHAMTHYTEPQ